MLQVILPDLTEYGIVIHISLGELTAYTIDTHTAAAVTGEGVRERCDNASTSNQPVSWDLLPSAGISREQGAAGGGPVCGVGATTANVGSPEISQRGSVAAGGEQAGEIGAGPGAEVLPGKISVHGSPTTGVSGSQVGLPEPATWSGTEEEQARPTVAAAVAAVTRSGSAGSQGASRRSDSSSPSDQVAAESGGGQDTGPGVLTEDVTVSSILATSSQGFQAALEADDSLKALKEQAAQPPSDSDPERVVWDQGRLYRATVQQGSPEAWPRDRQLVVPYPFRTELLRIAHEIPMAGHLGIAKTKARLNQHFYWPKMGADVAAYCRSCETCQRVGKAGPRPKAPLVSLPIIDEPFRRVAVDLVGPLAIPSSSGKRFILTDLCRKVFQIHNHITGLTITCSLQIGLLSMIPGAFKEIKQDLLRHFVATTRAIIP
ncbi:uncharacterized protein LOC142245764 [Anomaloglossus baeobatrachus]|uniref:uncharacterized protein LOC142245764 n=1 Tax=Anomaloglossus baeobatrachus TaxID=238106 RepID=UPI003F50AA86